MHVSVNEGTTGEAKVEVTDSDNLRQLDVTTAGLDAAAVSVALAKNDFGRVSDDHAWLSIEHLRSAARMTATLPDWDSQWENMIAYAAKSGWVSDDGTTVRAHIS